MSTMKRYDFDEGYRYESTGGEYVLYEDAMKRIKELERVHFEWEEVGNNSGDYYPADEVDKRIKALEDMLHDVDHHLSGSTLSTDMRMRDKIDALLNKVTIGTSE